MEGGSFTRDFEIWTKEGFGSEGSLIKLNYAPLWIQIMLEA
jgi:hypothetical protein